MATTAPQEKQTIINKHKPTIYKCNWTLLISFLGVAILVLPNFQHLPTRQWTGALEIPGAQRPSNARGFARGKCKLAGGWQVLILRHFPSQKTYVYYCVQIGICVCIYIYIVSHCQSWIPSARRWWPSPGAKGTECWRGSAGRFPAAVTSRRQRALCFMW